jgi:transcriptional regulator with XRE-family HTH domain
MPEVRPLDQARARLGLRVREIRLLQNKTQEDIAERSGLSYKFIGEVERGRANPSLDTLERLARGLGVAVSDLFLSDTRYPMTQPDVMVVREAVRSLEGVIARLRDTPAARTRVRRSRSR